MQYFIVNILPYLRQFILKLTGHTIHLPLNLSCLDTGLSVQIKPIKASK